MNIPVNPKNCGARIEKWWPIAAATIVSAAYGLFFRSITPPKTTVNLLSAIVSVAGIAVGFLAAAAAIIVSIEDSKIITDLKSTGHYRIFIDYLNAAMSWSFLLAVLSAVGLLCDFEVQHWPWYVVAAWLFVLVAATGSYYRVIRAFSTILRNHK